MMGRLYVFVQERERLRLIDAMTAVILIGAAWLRLHSLGAYSIAFDEVVDILRGRDDLGLPGLQSLPIGGTELWPVLASLADKVGGVAGARVVSALLSLLSVYAVGDLTRHFQDEPHSERARWYGCCAMIIVAVSAAPLAVARIATYDSLSETSAIVAVMLCRRVRHNPRRRLRLLTAGFLLLAIAAKYWAAVYIPVVGLFILGSTRASALRSLRWFWLPFLLAFAFAIVIKRSDFIAFVGTAFGHDLTDHRDAAGPLHAIRENVTSVWLLVLAIGSAFLKGAKGRAWCAACVAPVLVFTLLARHETSFWKYGAYLAAFSAPLLAHPVVLVGQFVSNAVRPRRISWIPPILAVAVFVVVGVPAQARADQWIYYYPNLLSAVDDIRRSTNGKSHIFTDEIALLYYLGPSRVVGVMSASTTALDERISAHEFDAIVFDGGNTALERRVHEQMNPRILETYQLERYLCPQLRRAIQTYPDARQIIEIYGPQTGPSRVPSPNVTFDFAQGPQGWILQEEAYAVGETRCEQFSLPWNEATVNFGPRETFLLRRQQTFNHARAQLELEAPGVDRDLKIVFLEDHSWQAQDVSIAVAPGMQTVELPLKPGTYRMLGFLAPAGARIHLRTVSLEE